MRIHHAVQRNHTHFGGAAANIHHHRACGFFNGQACANRGCHRFFNQINGGCARFLRRIADGFALHLRCAARHANHNARRGCPFAAVYFADKSFEHFACNHKIGNHAVFHRADSLDRTWGAPQHFFGFCAHRQRFIAPRVVHLHRYDRRFIQHNAFAFDVNQRIGCAQVNRNIVRKITRKEVQHKKS